jgi:hypothetical protein
MEKIEKLEQIIAELGNKEFNIYFFTIDTKGVASASVANMYEHVKLLNELGYKAHLLYDKEDYTGVEGWLGEEYSSLSHKVTKDLNIEPSDMIVVPEVFPTVMEQLSKFPCKKVVFAQTYSHIFELLGIGKTWNYDFRFFDVITTTDAQAEYIKNHFPQIRTHVISPSIPEYFTGQDEPKQPVIGIVARRPSDVLNVIKSFYLQYPMYKWVTFKDLRGLSRKEFAENIKSNCLSIWVDEISSFGTFPIESMECDTPVMGVIPKMVPEWMVTETEEGPALKDNGFWTDNALNLPTMIYEYMNLWMSDKVPGVIYENMDTTKGVYTVEKQKARIAEVFETMVKDSIEEFNNGLEQEKEKLKNE